MGEIFKQREEVEEFLYNLGVEYRFSCYKEHSPEGCHLLSEFLQLVRQDFKMAYSVLEYNCRAHNYAKSCNSQGSLLFAGRGVRANIKNSLELFKKACDNGSPEGCYHLGQMLSGKDHNVVNAGVKPKPDKAIAALEKGCELGSPDSCFEAGAFLWMGQDFGIKQDLGKAFQCMEKACNHFAPNFEACNNLMIMYKRGIGTKKDREAAAKVQEKLDDYIKMLEKERGATEMQRGT